MNNPAPHAPQRPRVANSDVRFRAMFPVQMLTRLTAAHGAPPAKSPPYLSFCGHIEQWQTNITGSDSSRSHIAEALPQGHWRRSIFNVCGCERSWWPIGSGRRSLALRAPSKTVAFSSPKSPLYPRPSQIDRSSTPYTTLSISHVLTHAESISSSPTSACPAQIPFASPTKVHQVLLHQTH